MPPAPADLGVYVHIPFCERVCPYCDFAVVARRRIDAAEEQRLVAALLTEARARAGAFAGAGLRTLYLGGGTPSLLQPASVERLVGELRALFAPGPLAEVTLELNPSTVERSRLPGFRRAGVDRLSVGVQSFDDALLRRLGRAHRAEEARATLAAARRAGFENLSLDLIFGIPGQTRGQLERDLERLLGHAPVHVSAYALTVEPGTPLATAVERGQLAMPDDDRTASFMETVAARLEGAGLHRYETSSYAYPGWEARHNRRYWERRAVLGLGVGAHSYEPPGAEAPHGRRRANERELSAWLARVEKGGAARPPHDERLDAREARCEAALLALRMREGISLEGFRAEFGSEPERVWPALRRLRAEGLLEQRGDRLRLTERGWLLSDGIFAELV